MTQSGQHDTDNILAVNQIRILGLQLLHKFHGKICHSQGMLEPSTTRKKKGCEISKTELREQLFHGITVST